jgi:two-component system chemotaxis response regulator CheY
MDHGTLVSFLGHRFHAEVIGAATLDAARSELHRGPFDLVLVNRIGDADGARGIEIIGALKADPALAAIPAMLVSNFPDAQQEAVTAGAAPGFGKAQLGEPHTIERLSAVLRRPI